MFSDFGSSEIHRSLQPIYSIAPSMGSLAGAIDEPVRATACLPAEIMSWLAYAHLARWLQDDSTLHPKFSGYRLKSHTYAAHAYPEFWERNPQCSNSPGARNHALSRPVPFRAAGEPKGYPHTRPKMIIFIFFYMDNEWQWWWTVGFGGSLGTTFSDNLTWLWQAVKADEIDL